MMDNKKYEQEKEAKLDGFIEEVAEEVAEEAAEGIVSALFGERKACKQIRIEAEQHTALKMLAAVEGVPLEEITKRIIAKGLGR